MGLRFKAYILRALELKEQARTIALQSLGQEAGGRFHFGYALTLNMAGREEEAEKAGREIVRLDPGYARGHAVLGEILKSREKREEAASEALKACQLQPKNRLYLYNVASNEEAAGRLGEAESLFRESLRLDPTSPDGHAQLARVLSRQGRPREALQECEEAFKELRGNLWASSVLFLVYGKLGQIEKARSLFRKSAEIAAEIAPGLPVLHLDWGKVLERWGMLEEALAVYRDALSRFPDGPDESSLWMALASALEASGSPLEAFDAWGRAFAWNPEVRTKAGYRRLITIHHREEGSPSLGEHWDALLERLEAKAREDDKNLRLLSVLALGYLHGEGRRDPGKARDCLSRALEQGGREDPDVLATLAEVQLLDGQTIQAVRSLEEVLRMPGADSLDRRLEEYRRALLPDLASYASIDAALASRGPETGEDREILEAFRRVATGGDVPWRFAYLEGRILQRSGKPEEAAGKFSSILESGDPSGLVKLRLAESLRASSAPAEAEKLLRGALASGSGDGRNLWELWFSICLDDLGMAPALAIESLPQKEGFGEDLGWLLEALQTGEGIRINCGGDEYRDSEGRLWGKDRFFLGGEANGPKQFAGTVDLDASLYRTRRHFPERGRAAYRIPLSRGTYQVSLRFAELWFLAPGQRRFCVCIEGEEVLKDYEPIPGGYRTPGRFDFTQKVSDGVLDIEFVRQINDPEVAAIEVERIE